MLKTFRVYFYTRMVNLPPGKFYVDFLSIKSDWISIIIKKDINNQIGCQDEIMFFYLKRGAILSQINF